MLRLQILCNAQAIDMSMLGRWEFVLVCELLYDVISTFA